MLLLGHKWWRRVVNLVTQPLPLGIRLAPMIISRSRLHHNFAVYYMGGNARISLAEFAYGNQTRDGKGMLIFVLPA